MQYNAERIDEKMFLRIGGEKSVNCIGGPS